LNSRTALTCGSATRAAARGLVMTGGSRKDGASHFPSI